MDKGASVLAKLKNKAKETGKSLQVHLQLFCQEEFLRKLSMSKYSEMLTFNNVIRVLDEKKQNISKSDFEIDDEIKKIEKLISGLFEDYLELSNRKRSTAYYI